jgi:hypothetical protein
MGTFKVFYSSNRDRQFQNHELPSVLSGLFSKFAKLYPDPEEYFLYREQVKKYIYVFYNNDFRSDVRVTELHGVFGEEMPNL